MTIDPLKCIERDCKKPRDVSENKHSWYCAEHNQEWRDHVNRRKDDNKKDGAVSTTGKYLDSMLHPKNKSTAIDVTDYRDERPVKIWTPSCIHRGLDPVITLKDGRQLYAAQGGNLTKRDHLDLVIDCAGAVRDAGAFVQGKGRWRSLNTFAGPEVIRLVWPDMTAPTHVGIRFWERLLEMLPQHTCVCCVGSHGRTGTALSCLLVAEGMDGEQAIVKVRGSHCSKAVETPEQERYVKGLRS